MTDLEFNVATILNNLASGFGGHSQVPDEVVGQALHGHFVNNPGLFRGVISDEAIEVAARHIAARWNVSDLPSIRVRLVRGFNAARAAIG